MNDSVRVCDKNNCSTKHFGRGMCVKHYFRWYYKNKGTYKCRTLPKHGMVDTPEWGAWWNAKQRCYNPNHRKYKDYGSRGIKMCDRWFNSFENFLKDMGKKPNNKLSLDRIDNDGNYEPANCRWATYSVQNHNRRKLTKTLMG